MYLFSLEPAMLFGIRLNSNIICVSFMTSYHTQVRPSWSPQMTPSSYGVRTCNRTLETQSSQAAPLTGTKRGLLSVGAQAEVFHDHTGAVSSPIQYLTGNHQ